MESPGIGSLWQLEQRCRAGSIEARIDACVAAHDLTGGEYNPAVEWGNAVQDLGALLKASRPIGGLQTRAGLEATRQAWLAAEAELLERINYAVRSWDRWAAQPDDKECSMSPTTKPKRTARRRKKPADASAEPRRAMVKAIENGRAVWLCPQCNSGNDLDERACACGYDAREDLALLYAERKLEGLPATQAEAAAKEAAAADEPPGDVRFVPRTSIRPSADNPRRRFDEKALQRLADSIKRHGVLQPILVYRGPEGLEIVGGERRWRAAGMAGVAEVPVRILDVTEEEAVELRGVENLQREQLDPIEEALWLRQMLDRCNYTQAALARRLGWKNQAQIAERVALLKLPEEWQQRIISREIPPSHARSLMAWRERPQLMERIARAFDEWREQKEATPSQAAFARLVARAATDCSRSMKRETYCERPCYFRPTKQQREELDIQDVPSPYGGETEPRAFNVALWNKLNKAARERADKRASAGSTDRGQPVTESAASSAPPAPEYDIDRVLDQRDMWLYAQMAQRVRQLPKREKRLPLQLWLLVSQMECGRDVDVPAIGRCLGMEEWESLSPWNAAPLWQPLGATGADDLQRLLRELVANAFERVVGDETGYASEGITDEAILRSVADRLGVDWSAWRPTADLLSLYPPEILREMPAAQRAADAGRLGVQLSPFDDRPPLEQVDEDVLIEAMIRNWEPGEFPPGWWSDTTDE